MAFKIHAKYQLMLLWKVATGGDAIDAVFVCRDSNSTSFYPFTMKFHHRRYSLH